MYLILCTYIPVLSRKWLDEIAYGNNYILLGIFGVIIMETMYYRIRKIIWKVKTLE